MRGRFNEIKFAKILLMVVVAVFVLGEVVMQLWNNILTPVLHVQTMNFWQALGLLVLCRILFGGFKGWGGGNARWRYRMFEKWQEMTPEDREKFQARFRNKCR
ncbi:hypothetical protein [Deminuibacter soli]|uniref:DUF1682 domain-containing protein n=1 Tax=Deminuibacter soli TaxID=2291815 RepID=A0A3E1NPJ5_9BACT|nr:hypothetical protein [Deminuibacter soli]RFM29851.1 hypothetical protein DXN05_02430 [Deminuibacter soli]